MASTTHCNKSRNISLPPGWEQRLDYVSNKPYYVNHNTKTTQWNPPTPLSPTPTPEIMDDIGAETYQNFTLLSTQTQKQQNTGIPELNLNGPQKRHARSSTFGNSLQFFQQNMENERKKLKISRKRSNSANENDFEQNIKSKPLPPPKRRGTISNRNSLKIKPPPSYNHKKLQKSKPLPPPPPPAQFVCLYALLFVYINAHNLTFYRNNALSLQQANSIKLNKTNETKTPHRTVLAMAKSLSPSAVKSFQTNKLTKTKNNHRKVSSDIHTFYRKKPKSPRKSSKNHRNHAATTTVSPRFASKMYQSSLTKTNSFFKDKIAKKYDKKKQKIKESLFKKHSIDDAFVKDEVEESITISSSESIEYSISTQNPLAPQLPPNFAIRHDIDSSDEEEMEKKEIEWFSLYEIVECVTNPSKRGADDMIVLLYTYCLYCNRKKLLHTIFDRLAAVSDDTQSQIKVISLLRTWLKTENDFDNGDDDKLEAISPRISDEFPLNEIDFLAQSSFDDEKENTPPHKIQKKSKKRMSHPPQSPVKLSVFAEHFRNELVVATKDNDVLSKLSKPILAQLRIRNFNSKFLGNRGRILSFGDAPTPWIPKVKSVNEIEFNKLNAMEVARQICLSEYEIFKKIKAEEFLKQNNSSKPNIESMTNWFNRLVVWTQIEILYQREANKRCKAMSNLLKICQALEGLNNISSLCAIRAGLCSAPIHRLKKTWDGISKKAKDIKMQIDALFKLGNGQKALRERVAIISQPAIPHLGLFLGDIVFIHDGNESFSKEDKNKINWSKMKLLADRIKWISMFQQSPYEFHRVQLIEEYLESKMKIVSEDFLYKLSREVEPPHKKAKK